MPTVRSPSPLSPLGAPRRRGAMFAALAVVVLAAAVVITLRGSTDGTPPQTRNARPVAPPGGAADAPAPPPPVAPDRVARRFIDGWLAYRSGLTAAAQIPDADPQLIARFPVLRHRGHRSVAGQVTLVSLDPGRVRAAFDIADGHRGGPYPAAVTLLTGTDGRWRAVSVEVPFPPSAARRR